MRQVRTTRPWGQNWRIFLRNHAQEIWACDPSPSYRPFLPFAFRLFHDRIALSQGDPCRRHTISHRRLDHTYRFGKPRRGDRGRNTFFGITRARLGWASHGLRTRVGSRFSQHHITHRERTLSVNAFWGVCGASASIICSSSMRSSFTECWAPMSSTSIELDPTRESSSRYQNRTSYQFYQITQVARFSPSRSWVDYIMTTAEVHELFHRVEEVRA